MSGNPDNAEIYKSFSVFYTSVSPRFTDVTCTICPVLQNARQFCDPSISETSSCISNLSEFCHQWILSVFRGDQNILTRFYEGGLKENKFGNIHK